MKDIRSEKNIFIFSIVMGILFWGVFVVLLNIEPWDTTYGWGAVGFLGFVLGLIGKEKPWLWPVGIFLGEFFFALGSFLKSLFFYSGGGANMFIPLGVIFLILFNIPAFIGSFLAFGIKNAATSRNK